MILFSKQNLTIQLYHSVLEDRLKYDQFTKYPIEEYAGIVTGKVQDAILKKEAALVVKQAYTKIIDIMKKASHKTLRLPIK